MSEVLASSNQELREHLIAIGLIGYVTGSVVELTDETSVMTYEQDIFEDTEDNSPKYHRRFRSDFPPDSTLEVGVRFSVATYHKDIDPQLSNGAVAGEVVHEMIVYDDKDLESQSIHALFAPVES